MTDQDFVTLYLMAGVTIDTIARLTRSSPASVRRRAARLGYKSRQNPRPAPICDDNPAPEDQPRLDARIRRRAAAIRRGWDDATEYSRRVIKGENRWHMPCIGSSPSEPVFDVGVAPTFMTAPMRTEEQIYSDRKKGSAA